MIQLQSYVKKHRGCIYWDPFIGILFFIILLFISHLVPHNVTEDQIDNSPTDKSTEELTVTTPVPTTITPSSPLTYKPLETSLPPSSTPLPPTPTPTVFIGYANVNIKGREAQVFELDFNNIAEAYEGFLIGSKISWDRFVSIQMQDDFRGLISFNRNEPYGYLGVQADFNLTPIPPKLGQYANLKFSLQNDKITDVVIMFSMHNKDEKYTYSKAAIPPHEPLFYVDRMCEGVTLGHDPVYFGRYEVLVKTGTILENWLPFCDAIDLTPQSPFFEKGKDFTDWEDQYFRIVYNDSDSFIFQNHPGNLRVELEEFDTVESMMDFDANNYSQIDNVNRTYKKGFRPCGSSKGTFLNIGFELVNHSSVDIRIYKIIVILKP